MNLNSELIQFMKWYKNNVPIGTQKNSVHIVDDYFKYLQNEQNQANGVKASEATAILPHVSGLLPAKSKDEILKAIQTAPKYPLIQEWVKNEHTNTNYMMGFYNGVRWLEGNNR